MNHLNHIKEWLTFLRGIDLYSELFRVITEHITAIKLLFFLPHRRVPLGYFELFPSWFAPTVAPPEKPAEKDENARVPVVVEF